VGASRFLSPAAYALRFPGDVVIGQPAPALRAWAAAGVPRPAVRPGETGRFAVRTEVLAYSGRVVEIPLEEVTREVTDAAHDAARGQVVYLTEHGERLAAIVPAELAAELESLTPAQFRELLEDFADAQAAREALAEVEAGAEPVPAEQVWAELGLGT
jgi:hypothetical protein